MNYRFTRIEAASGFCAQPIMCSETTQPISILNFKKSKQT